MKRLQFLLLLNIYPSLFGQNVTSIQFEGLERTSEVWLRQRIPISLPLQISPSNIQKLKEQYLSLQIFWDVSVEARGNILKIKVQEKWTTIPVLRGEFGGGTGLKVIGMYDIHTFGRKWTIGSELRQYGEAPVGGILYLRIPNLSGLYIGTDYWSLHRTQLIHHQAQWTHTIQSHQKKLRTRILHPISRHHQIGIDLTHIQQAPTQVQTHQEHPDFQLPLHSGTNSIPLASWVYDNVQIDNLHYQGFRQVARAGFSYANQIHPKFDYQIFAYRDLFPNHAIAGHLFLGQSNGNELSDWYILGGLEAVRGIPDGALIGKKILYSNLEWRYWIQKWQKLWIQGISFFDFGLTEKVQANSVGLGLRFAVPQVHRLMLRVDWAHSRQGFSGFSIGLNHFFQPYRPL